ncbi:MAG: RIP metalloprotease RseP [Parcubacteria group bacterium]|nr:RIP metalloprotease RseP [Parcubacteria group bacterium]
MFTTIIVFILVLGLLVFVHEFGHFITAKKFGAKAEEFGFGFPPRLGGIVKVDGKWKLVGKSKPSDKDFKNTIYSLNWIPIGGFVKIKGEAGEDADEKDSFASKSVFQRGVILFAGVAMNIVLTVVLLSIGFGVGLPAVIDDDISSSAIIRDAEIQIITVVENSPAEEVGIESGDVILSIDDIVFQNLSEFSDYTSTRENTAILVKIKRGEDEFLKELTPSFLPEYNFIGLGVGTAQVGTVSYPWYIAPWEGIKGTGYFLKEIVLAFGGLLGDLVKTGEVDVRLSGPVGIAVITGQVARLGFIYLLQFTAILSLNLAILNFFPFPALDGGRFIFLIVEAIRGKPVNRQIENIVHNIGFALLMILVVLVTYRDFTKFGGRMLEVLKSTFGL